MKQYALFYYKDIIGLGIIKQYLISNDGNFNASTNFTFKTKDEASRFYRENNIFPLATTIFIEGPRRGIYRAFSGK